MEEKSSHSYIKENYISACQNHYDVNPFQEFIGTYTRDDVDERFVYDIYTISVWLFNLENISLQI